MQPLSPSTWSACPGAATQASLPCLTRSSIRPLPQDAPRQCGARLRRNRLVPHPAFRRTALENRVPGRADHRRHRRPVPGLATFATTRRAGRWPGPGRPARPRPSIPQVPAAVALPAGHQGGFVSGRLEVMGSRGLGTREHGGLNGERTPGIGARPGRYPLRSPVRRCRMSGLFAYDAAETAPRREFARTSSHQVRQRAYTVQHPEQAA